MHEFERLFHDMSRGEAGSIFGIYAIYVLVLLLLRILFIVTVQQTMEQVSPDLRKMSPGAAWLLLVPLFNYIWSFILAGNVADSLADEFKRRNIGQFEDRPGYGIGTAWAFLGVLDLLIGFLGNFGISAIVEIVVLICFISYWAKLSGYKKQLQQSGHWQYYYQNQFAMNNAPPPAYSQPVWQPGMPQAQDNLYPPQQHFPPPPPNPFDLPPLPEQQPPTTKNEDLSRWMRPPGEK